MASPPPPPPSGSASPPSATHSDNSATNHRDTPPVPPKVEDAKENGVSDVVPEEKQPDLSHFEILDSPEYIDKYKRYEAEYTRRLMAKYFSKKNLYGGNVFEDKMTIHGETIMSSRWNCTQSFADPLKGFEEQRSAGHPNSTSTSED
ncbi:hypothetical protein Tsubulata_040338 [Turnera subulata]|uniref:Uncharacterized protein n=1 Tax=Turnera subulata TaxID=218843 RepID=A0A9Q0FZD6_9ROSI|nr:hypothetical protein Tsubulata_040338 [Turnera subulata]